MTDLQQAAARLKRLLMYGGDESYAAVYPHSKPGHVDDVHAAVRAYIATVQADDDTPQPLKSIQDALAAVEVLKGTKMPLSVAQPLTRDWRDLEIAAENARAFWVEVRE